LKVPSVRQSFDVVKLRDRGWCFDMMLGLISHLQLNSLLSLDFELLMSIHQMGSSKVTRTDSLKNIHLKMSSFALQTSYLTSRLPMWISVQGGNHSG